MEVKIHKVFIANRGEVVRRIHRTLKCLGIASAGMYTQADQKSYFVSELDETELVSSMQDYLNSDLIVDLAKSHGCDALHPGWGFLSENADFAQKCLDAGLVFIGPKPEHLRSLGDKSGAKEIAQKAGISTLSSLDELSLSSKDFLDQVQNMSRPLLLKPIFGGGGKGMQVLDEGMDLDEAYASAKRLAQSSFSRSELLAEPFLDKAKHVEVQIIGDQHGSVFHLGERDCTLQRRQQKVLEESPSPFLNPKQREAICKDALKLAKYVQYENAGTVEFLVDKKGRHYFMEVNTRLQVEHGVSEERWGVDLVELQVRSAQGEALNLSELKPKSNHVVQLRVYAEDVYAGFLPRVGKVLHHESPQDIRIEEDLPQGLELDSNFDPMLSKIIAVAKDRQQVFKSLSHALEQYVLLGLESNLNHLQWLLKQKDILGLHYHTRWLEAHLENFKDHEDESFPTQWSGILNQVSKQGSSKSFSNPWSSLTGWSLYE